MRYIATLDGKEYLIEIIDEHHVSINGCIREIDFVSVSGEPLFSLIVDGKSHESFVFETEEGWQVLMRGRQYKSSVQDEQERRLLAPVGNGIIELSEYHLKSPMPGLVVSIAIHEGDTVEKGQVLLTLESMKMQNEIKSPKAGIVKHIRIKQGEKVEQKQTLLSVL